MIIIYIYIHAHVHVYIHKEYSICMHAHTPTEPHRRKQSLIRQIPTDRQHELCHEESNENQW
jgi:hypothetical protein